MNKNKRIISLVLALSMIFTTFSLAFADITDKKVETAVNTLNSLGIINGMPNGKFEPTGLVTREEFAKIAVLALGGKDVSAYKNYTLFPDVKSSYWSTPYINKAVREYGIIKGLPNGTFNPFGKINYGEALTMMLYMLGYKIEDIGSFWPQDYVALAAKLGITTGLNFNAYDKVNRANTAIMISNLLNINMKDGSSTLLKKYFPYTDDDVVMLGDYKTLSGLESGQVKVSISGSDVIKKHKLTNINAGTSGTVVYEDATKTTIVAFLTKGSFTDYIIKNIYIDRIETEDKTINIPTSTKVIIDGKITTYGDSWLDVFKGSKMTVNYDESGEINNIAINNILIGDTTTFMYTTGSLKNNYPIYKNGVQITKEQINIDDVVTVDNAAGKVYVSDMKITGPYSAGTPSVFYPTTVTVMGKEFVVPENIRSNFSNININDNITLFLDFSGKVAFVKRDYKTHENVYIKSYESGKLNVVLESGIQTKVDVSEADSGTFLIGGDKISNIYKYIGKLAKLDIKTAGKIRVSEYTKLTEVSGNYDVSSATLGNLKVASDVEYYEGVSYTSGYDKIENSAVTLNVIPNQNILYVDTNSKGEVSKIIFSNLTGNNLDYGIVTATREQVLSDSLDGSESYYYENKVMLKADTTNYTYKSLDVQSMYRVPAGIQKNSNDKPYKQYIGISTLKNVGKVTADKFLASKYIEIGNTRYEIVEDVVVYDSANDRFVTMNYARQNYKNFEIYIDNALQSSKVRVIIVK